MLINYHLNKNGKYAKRFEIQEERFNFINQNNCDYNHEKMKKAGINNIDDLLNNYIGPTYLKYRGYTRDFDKVDANDNILLDQDANILSRDTTYQEYLSICGNEHATNIVLNAMATDCSADMVAWGYRFISGINRENINFEDINQAYWNYQNYFLPGSEKIISKIK